MAFIIFFFLINKKAEGIEISVYYIIPNGKFIHIDQLSQCMSISDFSGKY